MSTDRPKDLRRYVAAVVLENGKVLGTAFFIRSDGYLMTCYHVVKKHELELKVKLSDDVEPLKADVVKFNPELDVAILRINRNNCPELEVCGDWKAGMAVVTHGYSIDTPINEFPHGVPASFVIEGQTTVTSFSGHSNDALKLRGATVNRGLSGSPVLSQETGFVLGIMRYRHEPTDAAYAIPIEYLAQRFPVIESFWSRIKQLKDWGHLPYSLNRNPQFSRLIEETRLRISGEEKSPLFTIVHGSEDECPDALIDIYKDECLPLLVDGVGNIEWCPGFQIKDRHRFRSFDWTNVFWPRESSEKTLLKLNTLVTRDLLSLLPNLRNHAHEESLETLIRDSDHPVLIRATVDSELWNSADARLLTEWVRFWCELPRLELGQLVVVFFVIYYRENAASMFSRWRSPTAAIKRALKKIGEGPSVLPELASVPKLDGEDWVRELARRGQWQSTTQTVIDDVAAQFNGRADEHLNLLAASLKDVLNAHAHKENH